MNTDPADLLSLTFAALADPTRRAILARLARGEATVSELAQPFPISVQAVSKHLTVLERAGLTSRGRPAQLRPSRLRPDPSKDAPERLVFTVSDQPGDELFELVIVMLDDLGDGRTQMRFEQRGSMSPEQYERATEGWGTFFDRFEERLAAG